MSSARLIKIVVFADYSCPFTFIGNKLLMQAVDECHDLPIAFEVEYRPFRLNAGLSEDVPMDRGEFLIAKYGARLPQILQVSRTMANSLGLKFSATGQITQITRALRLSAKAYQVGGQHVQQALLQLYFKAFFEEGKHLGDYDLLGQCAETAGVMDKEKAIAFLKSNEYVEEVEATIAMAKANGIKGSPVVIVDGKFKLDGVQTKDTYLQVFKRLGKCEKAMASGSPCSDTSSDTVSQSPKSTAIAV